MDYVLRIAAVDDYSWLEELRRQAYRDLFFATWGAWDEARHKRHFSNFLTQGNILIVRSEQANVGIIQMSESPDRFTIEEIQILPLYQGKGLGTKLIQDAIAKAQRLNKDVYLSLGLHNKKAYRLYSRLGFQEYKKTETHFYMRKCISNKGEH